MTTRTNFTKPIVGAVVGLLAVGTLAAAAPGGSNSGSSGNAGKTLTLDVHFSPFEIVPSNASPDPNSPFKLGDLLIFHDLLFVSGKQVGDEAGFCVIVDPGQGLANCNSTIRLAGGTITTQFLNAPPPLKTLAITGGSGKYRKAAGDGTLLENPDQTGVETLHLVGD